MARSDLRAAVVGVGFVGVAHVENLRRLGVDVVGVVGSTPERARAKAAAAALPPVYESYAELLADPRVDVVHVTTPNHLHAAQVLQALDAGKHVVCEKPLAMDSGESAELLARATASGLVHAVCFNLRYYANNHEARALVAEGAVGRPNLVTGGYLQDWLLLETDWNWRLEPKVGGALRAVADIGSHWVDLVQFVTGLRITAVCADLHTFVPLRRRPLGEIETFAGAGTSAGGERIDVAMTSDDAAGVLLRFEDGAAWRLRDLAGVGRSPELAVVGGRRLRGGPGLELRGARRAVDRPPGAGQRGAAAGSGARGTLGGCGEPVPGRPPRGLSRHLPGPVRPGLRGHRSG